MQNYFKVILSPESALEFGLRRHGVERALQKQGSGAPKGGASRAFRRPPRSSRRFPEPALGYAIMLSVPGPAGFGSVLAASLMRAEQKPVPNHPGPRPGQFGTGSSPDRTKLAPSQTRRSRSQLPYGVALQRAFEFHLPLWPKQKSTVWYHSGQGRNGQQTTGVRGGMAVRTLPRDHA